MNFNRGQRASACNIVPVYVLLLWAFMAASSAFPKLLCAESTGKYTRRAARRTAESVVNVSSFLDWVREKVGSNQLEFNSIHNSNLSAQIVVTTPTGDTACLSYKEEDRIGKSLLTRSPCSSLRNNSGQLWDIDGIQGSGPFLLRNLGSGLCLVALPGCVDISLGKCHTDRALWSYHDNKTSIKSHICPLEGNVLVSDGVEVCTAGSFVLNMNLLRST
jgi:hypothetical protein